MSNDSFKRDIRKAELAALFFSIPVFLLSTSLLLAKFFLF